MLKNNQKTIFCQIDPFPGKKGSSPLLVLIDFIVLSSYYSIMRNLYVIQCSSGTEASIRDILLKETPESTPLLLMRSLIIRRAGKTSIEKKNLFPGYLFVSCDEILSLQNRLKERKGFVKILWENDNMIPLPDDEAALIQGLISNPNLNEIGISKGLMKDGRIVVTEGPLKDFTGKIISFDKRKQRARVELSLFNRSMLVDLGIELLTEK